MKRFSNQYKTFEQWRKQAKNTPYKRSIERKHTLYPKATLSQLRRHPRKGERALGKLKMVDISKRDFTILTSSQKEIRHRSFEVLSKMRRDGISLTKASREIGISPKTVIRHTNAVKKVGNMWQPTKYDKLSRGKMLINENGKEVWINVSDSRHATTIGKYHNAVKEFLETGDESVLKPFKGKKIKDSEGNWHTLDTDPDNLYEIQERREDEEFYTIYYE